MVTVLTWAGYVAAGLLAWLALGLVVAVAFCRCIPRMYDDEATPATQATKGDTP